MNKWIFRAGSAAFVVACGATASAQSNGPTGLSPRIGLLLPTSSGVKSPLYGLGLDYKLNSLGASVPGSGLISYFGLSVDYYATGSDSNLPVVINYNLRQGALVYSLGAGVDFYNLPQFNGSGTGFDAQAAVSYDFSTGAIPLFLQAKYFLASRSRLDGIGIYLGARF